MKFKIIDKSAMLRGGKEEKVGKEEKEKPVIKSKIDIDDIEGEEGEVVKCEINKVPVRLLSSDMISCEEIFCERMKKGMLNNCSICQNVNNDIFVRCQTKFR